MRNVWIKVAEKIETRILYYIYIYNRSFCASYGENVVEPDGPIMTK